jgi:hypothetical protein
MIHDYAVWIVKNLKSLGRQMLENLMLPCLLMSAKYCVFEPLDLHKLDL